MTTSDAEAFAAVPNGTSGANGPAEGGPVQPYPFWRVSDMRSLKPPTYVVERIVPNGSRTLIIAPSRHSTTMTAVDLVLSIAYRTEFHGLAVESMPVIYIANEDAYGVARQRILGWLEYYGHKDERIVVIPGDVLLSDPATPTRILATGAAAFPGQRFGVVLDTWDKSLGGDPDKTAEVVPAVLRMEELTRGGICAFVLTLAHTPWSNSDRSKGSVAFWASQEARIKVERNEQTGEGSLDVLHIKNGLPGLHLEFEYEVHEFGREGERATTLIPIRKMGAPEQRASKPTSAKRPLGANEKVVRDALAAAIADRPDPTPSGLDVPSQARGVTSKRWQEYAFRYLPQTEQKRKGEAFNRASAKLVADKLVHHVEGFAWLP